MDSKGDPSISSPAQAEFFLSSREVQQENWPQIAKFFMACTSGNKDAAICAVSMTLQNLAAWVTTSTAPVTEVTEPVAQPTIGKDEPTPVMVLEEESLPEELPVAIPTAPAGSGPFQPSPITDTTANKEGNSPAMDLEEDSFPEELPEAIPAPPPGPGPNPPPLIPPRLILPSFTPGSFEEEPDNNRWLEMCRWTYLCQDDIDKREVESVLLVPSGMKCVNAVVGKAQAHLAFIKHASGSTITVPKKIDTKSPLTRIVVTGTVAGNHKAVSLIMNRVIEHVHTQERRDILRLDNQDFLSRIYNSKAALMVSLPNQAATMLKEGLSTVEYVSGAKLKIISKKAMMQVSIESSSRVSAMRAEYLIERYLAIRSEANQKSEPTEGATTTPDATPSGDLIQMLGVWEQVIKHPDPALAPNPTDPIFQAPDPDYPEEQTQPSDWTLHNLTNQGSLPLWEGQINPDYNMQYGVLSELTGPSVVTMGPTMGPTILPNMFPNAFPSSVSGTLPGMSNPAVPFAASEPAPFGSPSLFMPSAQTATDSNPELLRLQLQVQLYEQLQQEQMRVQLAMQQGLLGSADQELMGPVMGFNGTPSPVGLDPGMVSSLSSWSDANTLPRLNALPGLNGAGGGGALLPSMGGGPSSRSRGAPTKEGEKEPRLQSLREIQETLRKMRNRARMGSADHRRRSPEREVDRSRERRRERERSPESAERRYGERTSVRERSRERDRDGSPPEQRNREKSGWDKKAEDMPHSGLGQFMKEFDEYAEHGNELADQVESTSSDHMSMDVNVPVNCVGRIIGKGGASIKNMRQVSGAQITISDDPSGGEMDFKTVVLKGTVEQVNAAHSLVREAIHSMQAAGLV